MSSDCVIYGSPQRPRHLAIRHVIADQEATEYEVQGHFMRGFTLALGERLGALIRRFERRGCSDHRSCHACADDCGNDGKRGTRLTIWVWQARFRLPSLYFSSWICGGQLMQFVLARTVISPLTRLARRSSMHLGLRSWVLHKDKPAVIHGKLLSRPTTIGG